MGFHWKVKATGGSVCCLDGPGIRVKLKIKYSVVYLCLEIQRDKNFCSKYRGVFVIKTFNNMRILPKESKSVCARKKGIWVLCNCPKERGFDVK